MGVLHLPRGPSLVAMLSKQARSFRSANTLHKNWLSAQHGFSQPAVFSSSSSHDASQAQARDLPMAEALKFRRLTERMSPPIKFHIRGVSFRQGVAADLQVGQSVLLMKEPDNTHDKNAVSIKTLAGEQLGYVPKETAPDITYGLLLGRVCSTGTTDDGVVGGSVMAHINLPPILLEPIPSAARAKVQALCQPRSTAASRALIRQRVKACEVMGIPQTELPQPLCVAPTFMYDATRKTVQLVKLMSVCPSVARAKGLLQLPQDSMEAAEAQELICLVNGWGMEELNTHVEWVRSRQAEMDVEGWEVKL